MPALAVEYRNAALRVELETATSAGLYINGIRRDFRSTDGTRPGILHLSSTVQTDYEWHEFIEATVTYSDTGIDIRICANNAEIVRDTFPSTLIQEA